MPSPLRDQVSNSSSIKPGIDFGQFRALLWAGIKQDLRGTARTRGQVRMSTFIRVLINLLMFIFYLLPGIFVAVPLWISSDVFNPGLWLVFYLMVFLWLSSLYATEYQFLLLTTANLDVYYANPISAATWTAALLTRSGLYLLLAAMAMMAGPAVVLLFKAPQVLPVVALTLPLVVITIIGLFTLGHTLLLRVFSPNILRTAIGIYQLTLTIPLYASYLFFPRFISYGASLHVEPSWWWTCFPPAWPVSLLLTAGGNFTVFNMLAAGIGVFAAAGLVVLTLTQFTPERFQAKLSPEAQTRRKVAGLPWVTHLFRHPMDRVVSTLIWRYFVSDTRLKLSVLAILPLMLLYVFMVWQMHLPSLDPFSSEVTHQAILFLSLPLFIAPGMLIESVIRREKGDVGWLWDSLPYPRSQIVRGTARTIFRLFLVPYLVLLGGVFLAFDTSWLSTAKFILLLGLSAWIMTWGLALLRKARPFSEPIQASNRSVSSLTLMFMPLVAILLVFTLRTVIIHVPSAYWVIVLLLVAAVPLMNFLTRTGKGRPVANWRHALRPEPPV